MSTQNEAGPSGVKRKRTPRVTSGQIDALLAFLEARPFLFTRKFSSLHGKEDFDEGWKVVALELNKIGSTKTAEQWMTVWRDFKSRACTKAAQLKKQIQQKKFGNRAVTTVPLTKVEQKIVSLVGGENSYGTDCTDSMPEELMIHEPTRVSASEVITSGFLPVIEIENYEIEMCTVEDPSGSRATVISSPSPPPPTPLPQTETNTTPQIRTCTPDKLLDSTRPISRSRNRNLNPHHNVAEEFGAAPQDFFAFAASNVEAMKMLAAATNTQAEAAKTHAEAIKDLAAAAKQQAEASKMHAESMMIFADAAKCQAQATVTLSTAADKLSEVLNILLK